MIKMRVICRLMKVKEGRGEQEGKGELEGGKIHKMKGREEERERTKKGK